MMEKDRYLSVFICFIGSSWQSESWVAGGSSRVFFCFVLLLGLVFCLFFYYKNCLTACGAAKIRDRTVTQIICLKVISQLRIENTKNQI